MGVLEERRAFRFKELFITGREKLIATGVGCFQKQLGLENVLDLRIQGSMNHGNWPQGHR